MSYQDDSLGENKKAALSTAATDYTIHFTNGDSKTSANDAATDRYLDNQVVVNALHLRTDKAISIVSIDGRTFTDPLTLAPNKTFSAVYGVPLINNIVLRTTVADTNVELFVRGRDAVSGE